MILKDVFLYPDMTEFRDRKDDLTAVKDQTRHIGNYLGRRLSRLKFHADGFGRVCVIGQTVPKPTYVNSSAALSVYIPFDMDECRSVPRIDLSNYYAFLFRIGLKKCASEYSVPIVELLFWLDEMRQSGYRNEWIFKEKSFRAKHIKCKLVCAMDLDKFTLQLSIFLRDVLVFDEVILTTPPDEVAFHYKFKDIVIKDDFIIVTDRIFGELFRTLIPRA